MSIKDRKYRLQNFVRGLLATAALGITLNYPVMAEQTGDTLNYNFTGRMMLATSCTINNSANDTLTVTFGNVGISKIDTGRYVQDLHYTLDCGHETNDKMYFMTIQGNPTSWDKQAIATSVNGLGVQVLKDGSPVDLNTYITIPDPSATPPALQIRLVKDPNVTLTEQPFTATGTLIIEYV